MRLWYVPGLRGWGCELDDFKVVRELGRGSSGVVQLAWQLSLQRTVALKRLLRVWTGDDDTNARLRREAEVIARLNHPSVVTLYDLVVDGSDLVLVMEHVRGPTLRALSAQAKPTPGQALSVVADVADALECASRSGIVHRDVKPANVFVTASGRCKLGDFGLAKISAEDAMFRTHDGLRRGTPLYMAPEQLLGAELTPACDVYALAIVAYELLAGMHPLQGLSASDAISAHLEGSLATMEFPAVPRPMAKALRAALAADPATRPTASSLSATLRRHSPAEWLSVTPDAEVRHMGDDDDLWASDGGWSKDDVDEATWHGVGMPETTTSTASTRLQDVFPTIDVAWLKPQRTPQSRWKWLSRPVIVTVAMFSASFVLVLIILELSRTR